ncbi:MAG: pyridoxal phosphate-dependent aminotransferase [Eubacteriales bacterium]|nr:pyridoxal phosphate-dependent aminotransferase [Eubacteriales bacterium]
MIQLSNRALNYRKSGIREMFVAKSNFPGCIDFTVGDPDFNTPEYIKQATKTAIDNNKTHYTDTAGILSLRKAIAKKYNQKLDIPLDEKNVIITVGASEALLISLLTVTDPGDEVIICDPAYPNYEMQADLAGVSVVRVPLYEKNQFELQPEDFEKAITPNTKAIYLNSPCNPLGSVMSQAAILKIAPIVEKYNLTVISDEVYDGLIYDKQNHFSMASIESIRDQVLVINSFSKNYAMTGYRIGYVIGPSAIVQKMQFQQSLANCVSEFIQIAAITAIEGSDDTTNHMRQTYEKRRDLLFDGINQIKGLHCIKPQGAFYAFVNIQHFEKSSYEFAIELLEKANVAVVPGSAFGSNGEGFIRLSYATSESNIEEGLCRIKNYIHNAYF